MQEDLAMNQAGESRVEFVDLKIQYAAMKESIDRRIHRVLEHMQFILGPEVGELEERLAGYVGAKHCITCASGTEALLIALMALGVKPGDEIITTPFTFVATAEMIVLLGAQPVFVDIEPDTCNIDVSKVAEAITPRTRAIMPVSLYGQPSDMDDINEIAARHGLAVIEDAAQSLGAVYRGRKSGNLSTIGCTSFFPSKPLGCYGDGGALFTSDDALAIAMKEIRSHGQSGRYRHTRIGVGGRMDTIQCAVLLAKLERFEWEIARRIEIARRYDALFCERVPDLRPVQIKPDRTSVYAQYTLTTPQRERIQAALKAQEIPTAVHYPTPLHRQPAYAHLAHGCRLATSERLAQEVVSLPMHAYLEPRVQERIASIVLEAAAAG